MHTQFNLNGPKLNKLIGSIINKTMKFRIQLFKIKQLNQSNLGVAMQIQTASEKSEKLSPIS